METATICTILLMVVGLTIFVILIIIFRGRLRAKEDETPKIEPRPPPPPKRQTVVGEHYVQPQPGQPTTWLIGIEGAVRGQRFPVDRVHYRIGSKGGSNLCIKDDDYVSGDHAYLRYEKGSLYLVDQDSRNGTYLNSQQVSHTPHVILRGDHIRVGESVLQVSDSPASADKPDYPFPAAERLDEAAIDGVPDRSVPPETERVEFTVFAPPRVTPNSVFIADVWAFVAKQYSTVTRMAQTLGRNANVGRKSGVSVPIGTILTITMHIEKLNISDPIDTIVWTGEPTNASFIIKVPANTVLGKYPGKAIIRSQGNILIAKIVFLISIDAQDTPEPVDHSAEILYPKTAFASYANENREEVLSRIQGMNKVAPDLDIFLDIISLRSGQNWQALLEEHVPTKDTFYLFWSQYASRSKWVKMEWQLALTRRGLDYIDPVPLEEPDRAPPPQELKALHFSDAYLAYIRSEQARKEHKG